MSFGAKRPRPCFLPVFLYLTVLREGRETQAVQSRFCNRQHSPKSLHLESLSCYRSSWAPSADEPSDVIGLSSLQRDNLQHYALCMRPFSPLLHTLAGHSCGVDLGRFPRSLSARLRRLYAALAVPSQCRLGDFVRLGSKSHLMRY